jgi:hypothetical protein
VDLTLVDRYAENFVGPDISKISADSENRGKYVKSGYFFYVFFFMTSK